MNDPLGGRTTQGRVVRRAILVVGITVAVAVFVSVRLHHSPSRPRGVSGKVIYHGTATVRDGGDVNVVLGDRSFDPTYVKGPAGARFVVHLRAEGFHAHSFTVPSLGIDVTVPPGGTADVPVTIPANPSTVFYCRFHQAQGMQGAITARQGASTS